MAHSVYIQLQRFKVRCRRCWRAIVAASPVVSRARYDAALAARERARKELRAHFNG